MRKRSGRRLMGLTGALVVYGTVSGWAATTLENPAPGALKSGVGVISGWVCDAEELEVSFDGGGGPSYPTGRSGLIRLESVGIVTTGSGCCGTTMNWGTGRIL